MLRQSRKAAQRYNKKSDRARNPPFFLPPSPQKRFFSCISAPQCPLLPHYTPLLRALQGTPLAQNIYGCQFITR